MMHDPMHGPKSQKSCANWLAAAPEYVVVIIAPLARAAAGRSDWRIGLLPGGVAPPTIRTHRQ
jgi:hypothetical protein